MPNTPRPSLLVRLATLTLALGVLALLVTQASLSTGCTASTPPAAPSAGPEPSPAATAPGSAAAPPALDLGNEIMPATKSGAMFRPRDLAPSPPARDAAQTNPAPNAPSGAR